MNVGYEDLVEQFFAAQSEDERRAVIPHIAAALHGDVAPLRHRFVLEKDHVITERTRNLNLGMRLRNPLARILNGDEHLQPGVPVLVYGKQGQVVTMKLVQTAGVRPQLVLRCESGHLSTFWPGQIEVGSSYSLWRFTDRLAGRLVFMVA